MRCGPVVTIDDVGTDVRRGRKHPSHRAGIHHERDDYQSPTSHKESRSSPHAVSVLSHLESAKHMSENRGKSGDRLDERERSRKPEAISHSYYSSHEERPFRVRTRNRPEMPRLLSIGNPGKKLIAVATGIKFRPAPVSIILPLCFRQSTSSIHAQLSIVEANETVGW